MPYRPAWRRLFRSPGGLEDALGDGDAAVAQQDLVPLPQEDGPGQFPHPQLRALEVQYEGGVLPPRLPGGGPVQPLQQGGALVQAGVGQIDPDACHPRPKQLV